MASRPASRQRKAAPAVSKATNSPSSSTTSSSRQVPEASLDGLSSPVSSSALSKPQYLYEDGLGFDVGGSKENVTVTVRFRPLRFGFRAVLLSPFFVENLEKRAFLRFGV